jgi:ComF family protein
MSSGLKIGDLLFPDRCTFCGRVTAGSGVDAVCASCLSRLPLRFKSSWLPWELLGIRRPSNLMSFVLCPLLYTDEVRSSLLALKFSGRRHVAHALASLLALSIKKELGCLPRAVLPVPLHEARLRERGFNQAEQIAARIGCVLGIPCHTEVLVRVRKTVRQSETESRAARQRNIAGAFFVDGTGLNKLLQDLDAAAGRQNREYVLLVDDVLTSGATLGEAARVLAGAVSGIQVLAAAAASNALAAKVFTAEGFTLGQAVRPDR